MWAIGWLHGLCAGEAPMTGDTRAGSAVQLPRPQSGRSWGFETPTPRTAGKASEWLRGTNPTACSLAAGCCAPSQVNSCETHRGGDVHSQSPALLSRAGLQAGTRGSARPWIWHSCSLCRKHPSLVGTPLCWASLYGGYPLSGGHPFLVSIALRWASLPAGHPSMVGIPLCGYPLYSEHLSTIGTPLWWIPPFWWAPLSSGHTPSLLGTPVAGGHPSLVGILLW